MKLLKQQYQDILNSLDAFHIAHQKITLVKKKGRIKIQLAGVESYFEFFRRKSVSLTDDDHQWQKSEHYELKVDGKASLVEDWEGVISHLNTWLTIVKYE